MLRIYPQCIWNLLLYKGLPLSTSWCLYFPWCLALPPCSSCSRCLLHVLCIPFTHDIQFTLLHKLWLERFGNLLWQVINPAPELPNWNFGYMLRYHSYLFSTLMSQTSFSPFSSEKSPEKSTHLPSVISWIPVAVIGLKETERVHAQAALAMLTLISKELQSNMKNTVEFWSSQNSLFLRIPSPQFLCIFCEFIFQCTSPGIEIFILEH